MPHALPAKPPRESLLLAVGLLLPLSMGVRQCENAPKPEPGCKAGKICGCEVDGKHYDVGESFKASDGCNTCSCEASGRALCTEIGCPLGADSGSADAAGSGGQAGEAGKPAAGSGGGAGSAGQAGEAGKPAAGSGGSDAPRCGRRGGVQCSSDQFCNFAPNMDCGGTDNGGVCEPRPAGCTDIYSPVCGCDRRTWGSACDAHRNGVSVKATGRCTPDDCTAAGGHIVTSGDASTPECKPDEEDWLVGPGRDFSLCCRAKPAAGKTCGGIAALRCGSEQFCNYERSAGGQGCDGTIADAAGVCQDIPRSACTREFRPVCGCNHRTYGNACEAHAAWTSIMHDGSCTESDCEAIGGRVSYGTGPGPMCNADETEFTSVVGNDGQIPIEGALCCLPK